MENVWGERKIIKEKVRGAMMHLKKRKAKDIIVLMSKMEENKDETAAEWIYKEW